MPRARQTFNHRDYVRLTDALDERIAREYGYRWDETRKIWFSRRDLAVEATVEMNNERNARLLPPGTDPMILHEEKIARRAARRR